MVYSMTAFARTQEESSAGLIICEMRSINHRYLEIGFHASDVLRGLEGAVRDQIKAVITRGKLDCALRLQHSTHTSEESLNVNFDYAKSLCEASQKIADMMSHPAEISPSDILSMPGVIQTKEINLDNVKKDVLKVVTVALNELIATRKREGAELAKLFTQRLNLMQKELVKVRERHPHVMQEIKSRLVNRFNEAKLELNPERLEQEMIIYSQRLDVTEEMERIETHIQEMKRVLETDGAIGRRLDFLLQELNREANTLGSKSVDTTMTHASVELKVLIEQIREQVQNVE